MQTTLTQEEQDRLYGELEGLRGSIWFSTELLKTVPKGADKKTEAIVAAQRVRRDEIKKVLGL